MIICGSREWEDREMIRDCLLQLPRTATIVVGYDPKKKYPPGADKIAYEEAGKLGMDIETHPADWERYRGMARINPAGFIRNGEMARSGAGLCLAFWDGRSNGTADMIHQANKRGIKVTVYYTS